MRAYRRALGVVLAGISTACTACRASAPSAQPTAGPPAENTISPAASAAEPPASADVASGIKAFDAGDYAAARRAFEAATQKNPRNDEAFYNLGLTCEKLGDKPAAESAYKAALAIAPGLDTAAAALSALYIDEGRADVAADVARAGLAKKPTSPALHENLGVALAARGDQDNAVHELERAIELQASEPMFHLTLAHWLNVWKIRGAVPHLEAARSLAKDDYGMIASIGHEYRMAGDFDGCIKTFDRAIQIRDGGEVRTERALCRHGLNDDKGTLEDLQAAVTKDPDYAPAHYYLAGRLAVGRHYKDAAAQYAKYIELAPQGSLAKPAAERLKAAQDAAKSAGGGPKRK